MAQSQGGSLPSRGRSPKTPSSKRDQSGQLDPMLTKDTGYPHLRHPNVGRKGLPGNGKRPGNPFGHEDIPKPKPQ